MKGAPAPSSASNSLRQRLGAVLLIFAALVPAAASAQSSGCAAVNANKLNLSGVFTSGNLGSTTGARFSTSVSDQAINALNISATSDPAAGTAAYDGSTYTFATGDVITYTVTVSGYSGSGSLVFNVRNGDSATTITNPTADTFTGDATRTYSYTVVGGETSIGVRIGKSATPNGTITVGATCVGAPTAPTVTALSPTAGPAAGGNSVTITGTGFTGVTDVSFGATPATSYTVNSATQITATAPAGSAGTTNVTVTTGGGTSAAAAANQYTYVAAPTITAVAPTAGPTAGGTSVVLSGTNLGGTTAVTFGGTPATSFTINSNTQITATAPAGAAGTVNVRATTTGGTSATAAANQYTYVSAPTVSAISPTAGAAAGGTTVTITGTNLTGATAVTFGGTAATSFTVNSATQITATSPAGSGTVDVRVTTVGGTSATSAADQFTYIAAPTVTALAPSVGSTAGGTSVVITGTNLTNATLVRFGGTPATSFTVNSATQITATSPAGSAGAVNVTVTTVGGTSATGAGNVFTYSVPPTNPVVSAPANGSTVGTTTPTYQGSSDANATITVYVDGASIGTTTATGAGTWSKTQPTALSAGSHTVRATATNAQGLVSGNSNTNTFTVTPPPVASTYTYGSIIAYNDGSNQQTNIDVASQTSGNPTSYAVGSATTANGGSVSISNTGQATYTPPVGYRGNDSFTYTATNAGGTSSPGTVTVAIGNPTITASLSGSGTRGTALSGVQVLPSGGAAPYSCGTTIASGALPAGTQLNANCTISGTPTASGTFNFTANVTDSSTGTGPFTQVTGTLSLTVAAPTLTISPAAGALPGATAGAAYSQTFTASGGTAPYTYAVTAGSVPPGLALVNGTLSGTPTQTGTYNFTVRATDSSTAGSGGPYTVSNSYSITVSAPAITLAPTTLSNATAGAAYTANVTASGGTAPYTYSIATGALPAGLSLSTGGAITGTPTAAGTFNFTIRATDSTLGGTYSGTQAYALVVQQPAITLAPTTLTAGSVGTAYTANVTASGGTAPYSYSITTGALPAGLSLSTGGAITGTPTAGGSFNFTVTATDSTGGSGPFAGSRPYVLTIAAPTIALAPTTLTNATAGTSYSQAITASGGTGPYTFAVSAGALPAGLSLASDGTLSGTPTAGGSFTFTVRATDSSTGSGAPYSGTRSYTLTVNPATIVVAPTTLPNAAAGTPYSQTITASGGNGPYTFAVTAGALPPGWTLSSAGVLSGTATASDSFTFTITATDSSTGTGAPYSGSRSYTVNVGSPNFTLTAPTLSATVGQPYTGNFVAGGGTAPYNYFRSAGTLPPGLTLAGDGTLSGTPTAGGTFNFTVIARDSTTGPGSPYGVGSGYTFTVSAPALALAPATLANGSVGSAYVETVSASGGTSPYSYAVTAGALPAGVSLNSSSGVISGTPTAGGTFNFTVRATDSSTGTGAPFTASRAYALTINAPTITLTPMTLPNGTPGAAYSQMLTAAGGTAPYSFAVTAGALPPGLSLSSGTITGTPTASGTYNFTVTATDSSTGTGAPYSGGQAYTLVIGTPTIAVDTTTLPNATVAGSYSQTLTASGGTAPYSYAITAGALPAGVTLSSTGAISGTPTAGGTFNFTVTATDSSGGSGPFSGSRALTLVVNAPTIALAPATLPTAEVGVIYSQAITATGGTAGYSYTVTAGALPAGVTLSSAGVLTGTPTASGTFNFTVAATDSSTGTGPYTGTRSYALTVGTPTLTLAPTTLPDAQVATAYNGTITASGGTAPYNYAVTAGALPAGVSLAANGQLSGTPSAGGTFNFTVTATDSSTGAGAPFTASRAYALTVAAPTIAIAPTTLPGGQMEVPYSQALTASGGTAPYSYAVTAGALPAGLALTSAGTLSGTPTVHGTFNFTVTTTDASTGSGPFTGSRSYSLVIATPAAPVAGSTSATVGYNAGATPILLPLSGGTATSVAIASAPAHGTVTVSGTTVSYTPATGYYGADSFTYTATNDGGTSAPATVSITVNVPPAPTAADRSGVAVAYNSAGTAIDLSSSITGVHSSIAIGTAPTHGTVSISGDVVTYTPTTGYYGADSFTYTATGPGGTSAPATVSLTVATPAAPTAADRSGVTVAYASSGTAIDLSSSITGVHSSIAVGTGPAHGTVTVSGDVVTYTPAATYYGPDSFTYTATGPGGTSAPATVSLTVATPAAPTAADRSGVAVAYNSAGTPIDLSGSITGVHSSIAVATAPAHGTVSISGDVVTYTPTTGYYGADSFTYTATGPGGASAPATVSLNVAIPPAPTAADRSGVAVAYNSAGTAIDLSGSITGVHSSIAVATAPAHGTVSISGDVVTYTPTTGYYGADGFTYTATGPGGTSAPATVSLNVAVPPAPAAADVSGVAVPYASSGTTIDLSGSITGVHSSIAIGTAPAHGTVTISGDVVTYTPAATYYGPDSFTYTATGPGGTSAPATVSLTVATPAAPTAADRSGVVVPYASSGTAIDLSSSISGVHSSIAVPGAPAHGTVSVSGDVVTYTPAATYYGPDSFTYTATGPGGTSAPATVSLTVATPAAPTAANVSNVAVPYNSTGTAIDLSGSITGVHSSVAVATAPTHGTVTVSGDVVTYTPTAGYYGADSFTYTATGPGGTSSPATVSLTVATPAAPTAANVSNVAVPYNSTGTAIDLSGAITGVHSSVAITTAPTHGTVTISGDVATYTPTAGYYGADSFTYTATGPGGTSSPATVNLTVATPAAPTAANRSNVAIAYNSPGTAIDLSSSITGVHSSIAIVTAPAHGTATVSGDVVTYKPATDYHGADSFTYTATGPGGTSSPATVSVVVDAPPPPVATSGSGTVAGSTSTTGTQSVDINLSALVSGEYDRIEIDTPPAHGTVTLSGNPAARTSGIGTLAVPQVTATYRPAVGFVGTDTFTFVAVGPGGRSAPATVSVTVVGSVPVAQAKTAQVGDGQSVSVNLTDGATEGPFTGATVVSVTPAGQATATIVESGSGASRAYRLDVVAAARFSGNVVVRYTLSNAYGTSQPATVTVTVTARPNPTDDPNIRAISDAQAETARRFARSQVSNFMRRTEQLHGDAGGTGASMGVTLNSRDGRGITRAAPAFDASALEITERMRPSAEDPTLGRVLSSREGQRLDRADQLGGLASLGTVAATDRKPARNVAGVAGATEAAGQDEEAGDGVRRLGSVGIWSGGAVDIGTRDATTDRSKITATTAGLSGGADIKLAEGVVVGLGGGYGNDFSRIDGGAARVRSDSSLVAAYASVSPINEAFIDGMIGRGDLSFRTRRIVPATNATALGSRDGSFTVGALAVGIDRQSEGFGWSIYGRGEFLDAKLGAYVESGAGRYDLRFDERKLSSVTGTLGARLEFRQKYDFGTVVPRLRAEWNHEFADADAQRLDYADIPGTSFYSIDTSGWSREQYQLNLGARFLLPSLWSFDFETGFRGAAKERAGTLRVQITKEF